ncbi:alanine:cation symporter family protein [Treponema phagedenis]|uniref:Putative sodium/glutamine symporter GlnT n=1 Tax=Treponema phagedenis TaxID=162 RepID=A0A0B7GUF9_TREPH|nr:alanine/glycine:cation symporter family protein [Treponema phagedenis]NVP24450.1 alanine:cation symporter family protein [Treponema phagedenis]QKS92698.1 alanine:cation symporter family protein [Treponema phagedenis]QLC58663.1 alanine:cation symporter family protein [Treponema phagedenis]QSH93466.1 alanine:cation symporter family protein [Treponema phagedenis]QSH99739.1 alanine:cation symporter family protein [Treponema phagedenis]
MAWFSSALGMINGCLYYPILIILLLGVGLYFTLRTGFLQGRLLKETIRIVKEKPEHAGSVSSFQALMVSTASRVGTGNIVGVANAICLGGYGAVFWMWVVAIVGGSSAFIESTLAQIYKKRDENGGSYGGPSYYIETALKSRALGIVFAVSLILTYAVGFNMLAAYNLQTSFQLYEFYNPNVTPWIIGAVLALITGYCVLGGGKRIIKFTSTLVPLMSIIYILVSLIMLVVHIGLLPSIFVKIFQDAFNFKAIFGGIAGSCMVYGIKRGLYSNEAGIGSAPNAAAAADVSHPVKQGLVQMLSVFIDTVLIGSATAFMCLGSGIEPSAELAGAPYVQKALSVIMGNFGHYFITFSLILFAFTTLLGNLFYVDSNLAYINGKTPSKTFMTIYRIFAAVIILFGAAQQQALAWDIGDFLMGVMALINLPAILILGKTAILALKDYEKQRKEGKDPVFHAKDIGIDTSNLDYWK